MDKVLLVIPAYNEGKNIERVVDHIKNDFPELDYVVVNDGSKDNSLKIIPSCSYIEKKLSKLANSCDFLHK